MPFSRSWNHFLNGSTPIKLYLIMMGGWRLSNKRLWMSSVLFYSLLVFSDWCSLGGAVWPGIQMGLQGNPCEQHSNEYYNRLSIILQHHWELGFIIFILQMRKLRQREVKQPTKIIPYDVVPGNLTPQTTFNHNAHIIYTRLSSPEFG